MRRVDAQGDTHEDADILAIEDGWHSLVSGSVNFICLLLINLTILLTTDE